MRYVIELDAYLDGLDFSMLFQVSSLALVLLMALALQYSEKLDHIVERVPSRWRWIRRITSTIQALMLLWLMFYQSETGWKPWPPLVAFIIAHLLNTGARLIIVYMDYCRSSRLGGTVATIADTLSVMRTGYADEGKTLPRVPR